MLLLALAWVVAITPTPRCLYTCHATLGARRCVGATTTATATAACADAVVAKRTTTSARPRRSAEVVVSARASAGGGGDWRLATPHVLRSCDCPHARRELQRGSGRGGVVDGRADNRHHN